MNANVAHTELARPLDERYTNVGAIEFEAEALRTPLRVALPGSDGVAVECILHELERGYFRASIRHHHGVEEEPVSAFHAVDQNSHSICLFKREWVVFG